MRLATVDPHVRGEPERHTPVAGGLVEVGARSSGEADAREAGDVVADPLQMVGEECLLRDVVVARVEQVDDLVGEVAVRLRGGRGERANLSARFKILDLAGVGSSRCATF